MKTELDLWQWTYLLPCLFSVGFLTNLLPQRLCELFSWSFDKSRTVWLYHHIWNLHGKIMRVYFSNTLSSLSEIRLTSCLGRCSRAYYVTWWLNDAIFKMWRHTLQWRQYLVGAISITLAIRDHNHECLCMCSSETPFLDWLMSTPCILQQL